MLEVINGFLLIYFVCLCTINVFVPHLVKPIVACFLRPSSEERKIWADILKLRSEQSGMSIKDEFAAYSKLQRKVYKLETRLKEDSQLRISKSLAVKGTVQIGLQVIVALLIAVSVIWFRNEPIVALKGNLFPFSTFLRYPSNVPNAISTHVWVLITNFSIKCLMKPVLT